MDDYTFTQAVFWAPATTLHSLLTSAASDQRTLARVAALHFAVGNKAEALQLATQAIARGDLDPYSASRALMIRGMAGGELLMDPRFRLDNMESVAILERNGLEGSDIHVVALINWAGTQSMGSRSHEALATLDICREYAHKLPKSWALRAHRLLAIELNVAFLTLRPAERPLALIELADKLQHASAHAHAALCHSLIAGIMRSSDLYTAALAHSAQAASLYEVADMPHHAARAKLDSAKVLRNSGAFAQAEQIIESVTRRTPGTSAARVNSAIGLGILADHLQVYADLKGSLALFEKAYGLISAMLEQYPGYIQDSNLEVAIVVPLFVALESDDTSEYAKWLSRLERHARRVSRADPDSLLGQFLWLFHAAATRDHAAIDRILSTAIPDFGQQGDPDVTPESFRKLLVQLPELMTTIHSGSADLSEYWGHVVHLTGEDDETVRSAFRRGNVLPVLHRLLMRGEMSSFQQFEIIELSRWGSLSGALGNAGLSSGGRAHLREVFLSQAAVRAQSFPASLGHPRGLKLRGSYSSTDPDEPETQIDLEQVLAKGGWSESPEVLQIYLLRDQVHWTHLDCEGWSINSGTIVINPSVARMLQSMLVWASPLPQQMDHEAVAAFDLDEEALLNVAAARCCVGPFVQNPDLARDFLVGTPAASRSKVARWIDRIEVPQLHLLTESMAWLLPPFIDFTSHRPLMLSLSNELGQLPFSLARRGAQYLGVERPLVVMPPINTLARTLRAATNHEVGRWDSLVVGNGRGDLGYAGRSSSTTPLRNAFLISDEGLASRTAVLYRGHYDIPSITRPSSSGVPEDAESDRLLTAKEILSSDQFAPARVALMSCRGSGLAFPDEWGGIAAALMVKGAREILAPSWLIIDSREASVVDELAGRILGRAGSLEYSFQAMISDLMDNWLAEAPAAIAPHWWSGLSLLKG